MSAFIEFFGELTLSSVVTFIVAISFVIGCFIKLYKFIVKNHDLQQEKNQVLKDIQVKLAEITTNQEKLETTMKTFTSKQQDLEEGLVLISEQQELLAEQQKKFENTYKERNVNRLRELLIQNYNYYYNENTNPLRMWTSLEKESFNKLLKDYEAVDGNGYIHSHVVPDLSTLIEIKMDDIEGLNKLYKSRSK
jgi:hypothetical protein